MMVHIWAACIRILLSSAASMGCIGKNIANYPKINAHCACTRYALCALCTTTPMHEGAGRYVCLWTKS